MLPDELIASIFIYVPSKDVLKYLKFFNKSFGRILHKYGKLFSLDLRNSEVTNNDLYYLNGVRKINLSNCNQITDEGLMNLKRINTIYLSCNNAITDAGLVHLKGVNTIDLSRNNSITDAGLAHLKGVNTIDLSDCKNITDDGLAHLKGVSETLAGSTLHTIYCLIARI